MSRSYSLTKNLCWYKILQPLNGLCCLIHMFLLWRSDLKINVYLIYLKISFVLCKYIYTRQNSIVTQDSGTDNCTHHCLLCYMFAIKRIHQPKHQVHHVFNKYTIQNNNYSSKLIYGVSLWGNFFHEFTHFSANNLQVQNCTCVLKKTNKRYPFWNLSIDGGSLFSLLVVTTPFMNSEITIQCSTNPP